MFKEIYEHLKTGNFDVYSIGQHKGLCQSPYVVIKENSTSPTATSLAYSLVDILIYCPIGKYSAVSDFIKDVKTSIKSLTWLKFTNNVSPVVIDENVNAYMCSLQYKIFKRRD